MSRTRTHLHYSDYTDSHWWSGSVTDGGGIWIRDPIVDGDLTNNLDGAMELLDQARKEVQAIENMFGTNPAGTLTDLGDRLERRVSPCGIRRGAIVNLRGPNPVVGTPSVVWNWWEGGSVYWQLFRFRDTTGGGTVNVTFPKAYFTSLEPELIVVQFAKVSQLIGSVQLDVTSITTSGFTFFSRAHDGTGGWDAPGGTVDYYICAVGGFPSS